MGSGAAHYFKVLSPSNVNAFLDWRSKWFLENVMKKKLPKTPDIFRGTAVEQGVTKFLSGALDEPDARAYALEFFSHETADLDVDDAAESAASIPDLVSVGIGALGKYGKLEAVQRKIWLDYGNPTLPDTVLPWMGYADFIFEGGVLVDLKVTGRTPSEMSHAHARQGAFYKHAIPGIKKVDFVYLVPLKKGVNAVTHTLEKSEAHLEDLRQGAIAMDKALAFSDNPEDLKHAFHPAPGDWWLKDPMAFNTAREVWNLSL